MNMDALLRIQAKVTGAEQISQLQGKFKQVEGAAVGLTKTSGLLSGALGSLAPVVTIGGLGALVSKTIEAGDAMNDMSQRTGVSVESLARFKKAAATSGTDIDNVAKSLGRLSKGMYEASTTGKGPAAEALKALGISATDATGKLKSADQVTLEIANRFKAMPDGVEKTALAMQLFGKSGAEMIPMLNMGGDAIDKLSVKMTKAFAEKADEYNDKLAMLSGKVGGLAMGLTVALLPALDGLATGLTLVVDGFTKLPGPVQAVVGGLALLAVGAAALAPILSSILTVAGALAGLQLGATIAGWLGAIGPLITTVGTFVAGIVGWPLLVGAALVGIGALVYNFRDQIGTAIGAIAQGIKDGIAGAWGWIKDRFGELTGWISNVPQKAADTLGAITKGIRDGIAGAWGWIQDRFSQLTEWVGGLVKSAGDVLGRLGDAIKSPFIAAADTIRGVLRSVAQSVVGIINNVLERINGLVIGANRIAAKIPGGPQLPTIPYATVPQFATGAYVTQATPAVFGEAGPEYAIPASKMQSASLAYLGGARGAAVLQGGGSGSMAAPRVTIQTGPVIQQPDGSQWVSIGDLEQAMNATAQAVFRQLRTPSARLALGGA